MKRQVPSILGDGFFLRPWQVTDAAWYVENRDEEIFRWTTEKRTLTVEETENAIRQVNESSEAHCFAIIDAASGQILGKIALTVDEPQEPHSAEIMYWLAAPARGRGIATRAVRQMCEWAFTEFHLKRIFLKTYPGNLRSQLVAQRAGFQLRADLAALEPGNVWFERVATESRP